ncbi:MAG: lipid A biosynthesis lauroyl acyltransferase [Labrys sp. (in: a-proteobacteria)]|jgi:KDO2-lipid IV(A) lauroyltransferase
MNRATVLTLVQRAIREVRDLALASLALIAGLFTRLLPERAVVGAVGYLGRRVGMLIPRYVRIGRRNLTLAYPDKTPEERDAILRDSWENMARTAAEYFYIDRIWDYEHGSGKPSRLDLDGIERFIELAHDGKPAIILSAHLGNWELPMVAAARHGLDATALYNRPRNRWIARMVVARRNDTMADLIESGPGTLHRLATRLEAGRHVGMLVDQHYGLGPKIMLFGHQTTGNPIFARLARQIDCPVHAVRVIRLPAGRFRIELTPALTLPRDARGLVDVQASVQMVADLFEGWIRENPGQWLWVHRRWR